MPNNNKFSVLFFGFNSQPCFTTRSELYDFKVNRLLADSNSPEALLKFNKDVDFEKLGCKLLVTDIKELVCYSFGLFKSAFLKPWVATQKWVAKTMRMGREAL